MRSIHDPAARSELQSRLRTLAPDATRRWGKMNVHQMLCHIGDQMRVALGDLKTEPKPTFLRNRLLRHIIVHRLPWPRGAPTAPEMLSSRPASWDADVKEVAALMDRFAGLERRADSEWPEHPAFGPLSTEEWGWLVYKHNDHHFKQFGV